MFGRTTNAVEFIRFCFLFGLYFLIGGCAALPESTSKKSKQFYYWKQKYEIPKSVEKVMQECKTSKIYLHCFDIVRSPSGAIPISKISWATKADTSKAYIPVVFVQKDVFKNNDSLLPQRVYQLVNDILAAQHITCNEIQIDCDWTPKERDNYFNFLQQLKNVSKKNISITLRLYPYKYRSICGIPPCDKVVLMCYNMGKFSDVQSENSILDIHEMEKYLITQPYPKPLAVALPIFEWQVVFRNGIFQRLCYQLPLQKKEIFKQSKNWYTTQIAYYDSVADINLEPGDSVRYEQVSQENLVQAYQVLQKKVSSPIEELIIFALDSTLISHYELDKI